MVTDEENQAGIRAMREAHKKRMALPKVVTVEIDGETVATKKVFTRGGLYWAAKKVAGKSKIEIIGYRWGNEIGKYTGVPFITHRVYRSATNHKILYLVSLD